MGIIGNKMAIIKKFSPKENLNTFSTLITDTNPNSTYFRITEFKDTFSGGKNGFLIEGSEHLKETTEIKIEILDVEGNPIYFEPGDGIPEYYEGISKVIAVYVYNDTPIGQAQITVLGELKTYLEGDVVRDIPEEWKGVYNVKWQKSFKVNKLLPNEDKVRFYRRPIVNIEEIVKPIFNTNIPTVTQSGSVRGIPNTPLENQSLTNFTQPTSYRLEIVGDGAWTGSIVGNVIEFDNLGYFPTVTDIVNSKNIIVNPPYTINGIVKSFANQPYTSSFEYIEGIENNDSPLTGSFAKINITELKTFVGDIARVKVFRKSKSNVGDYEFVQEIQLESNEILVDLDVAGKNEEPYGLFTDSNIYTYWVTSSNDITVDFNQSYLYNSAKIDSNSVTQYFYTSASLPIQTGIEYTLSFGLRSGDETTTNYIQAFISGSRQSTVNGNPTTIQIRENVVKINSSKFALQKQTVTENFIADEIDDARLYFEVVGTDWYINDVSLKASQETSFSPDEITFIQSVPKTLQVETFDYRFDFYDINNNYIPVNVFKTQRFVGGNTALLNRSLDLNPTNLFFSFDSASNPVGVTVINFDIVRNLLTGSVTFTSGAYDSNGDLIPSVGYVGQYPGLLTNVSDTSATLTAANFTGSDANYTVQYITYTASCEDVQTKETISRVSAGATGESGVNYIIKSFNGNLIRNYEPDKKIELQAYRIDGSQLNFISGGDFKLAVVSESLYLPISAASSSGFLPDAEVGVSGSEDIDYNARFGRESISGSLDVYLISGSTIFDSITIADVLDGSSVGVVEASTYVFVKNPNDTFTPLSSSITATFFDRRDAFEPITASLIVYPSHSFLPPNDDNDINHMYYETGSIDSRITLLVRDSDGSFFNSGKENARETELVNLGFSFVDSTGQTIRAFETIHIATSGDFGKSSIFVDVTPPNFVFIADETGNILNYDDLTTFVQVYYGTTLLQPSINLGIPGTFTASFSPTNITISDISLNTTGITIGQFSNMIGIAGGVKYDLIVTPPPTSVYKTESFNSSFTQSFSVVRGGRNSRSVNLSADTYIVIYDGDGEIISPPSATIQLQAEAINHTGSVYYQFLKNNVTQSAPSLLDTYELPSLDIVEPGETDVWSVRTRESLTGPIVAVNSISIAGVKNGKDSRSVALIASSNFVNYDGMGSESPVGQEITLTATPINHVGVVLYEFKSGSTTIQSGSSATYIISSSYTQSTAPNIPVKPLVNESHVYSVFTREGTLASSILSADATTISGIKAGADAYTINLSNGSVTLPTTVAGVVSFGGSGTAISVFRGDTELNSVNSTPTTNQFSASIFSKSAHISATGPVDISGNPAIFSDITGWNPTSTSSGSIVYAINVENLHTFYRTQSFALSYEGAIGPGLIMRGEWTGSIDYEFDVAAKRRDAVFREISGNVHYWATTEDLVKSISAPYTTIPFYDGNQQSGDIDANGWQYLGQEDFFVAAKLAIFEQSFVKNTINVGNNPTNDKANIVIQGSGSFPYIAIGQTGSVIGYEQPGIFMGVSVANENLQRFSIVSDNNTNSLKWDGSNLTLSGSIVATSGRISGLVVVGQTGTGITLDGVDKKIYIGQGQYANSNTPFYAASGSSDNFSLGDKLTFDGSDLSVSGSIITESGSIAGWQINNDSLKKEISNKGVEINANNQSIKFYNITASQQATQLLIDTSTTDDYSQYTGSLYQFFSFTTSSITTQVTGTPITYTIPNVTSSINLTDNKFIPYSFEFDISIDDILGPGDSDVAIFVDIVIYGKNNNGDILNYIYEEQAQLWARNNRANALIIVPSISGTHKYDFRKIITTDYNIVWSEIEIIRFGGSGGYTPTFTIGNIAIRKYRPVVVINNLGLALVNGRSVINTQSIPSNERVSLLETRIKYLEDNLL
jgi:hypothetical protein